MDKQEALKVLKQAVEECEVRCGGTHLVVIDKGWVFHGNLIPPTEPDGDYTITNCVNVRRWSGVGYGGLSLGAASAKAVLDPCAPQKFKERVVILRCATSDDWRIK
jgi:hypothetical protein